MNDASTLALVSRLSRDLDAEGIPHALTGSIAAGLHGEPIISIDVDIVVNMTPERARSLARRWKDLQADEESFRQAAESQSITNVLDIHTGLKIDVSVLPDTPYYREVMKRRIRFDAGDRKESFWVVTREDIILMKLWWRRETRSEKQWANALSVVRVQGLKLDWAYLYKWAGELGIEEDLRELAREGGI